MAEKSVPITVAHGDGIGPELMEAVLLILKESKAPLSISTIEVGEKLYLRNYTSGIADDTWKSIDNTKVLLKAPITTPQGGGYKSLNVTLRKALGLFANVRPSIAYSPFVSTAHPNMDLVIIRENEEDLYAGIEYRQTHNMYESLKLISSVGSEKIIRFAFDYATKNGRGLVSCFCKDNIMKFSDGIFHKKFDEIALEYPNIENNNYIVDIGTARLAKNPALFNVIVTSNLYGDIISDVASDISGSVGLAGSANIGTKYAMFEAVHGSAPHMAGKNSANPSGLLNAAIMMLVHVGLPEYAEKIENAWKKTLEDGVHTQDIFREGVSQQKVGTREFAEAVASRLGQKPSTLKVAQYASKGADNSNAISDRKYTIDVSENKELVGVDVFVDMKISSAHDVADRIAVCVQNCPLKMQTISSMGLKLWPSESRKETLSDHWCIRFMKENNAVCQHSELAQLLILLANSNIDYIKTENLYNFDGVRGYSLSQGE